jgi:thiamine-phosphate pyrophosphorylase
MLRYAITSRTQYPGDELQKQTALIEEIARWTADGIELIQLREKDLPTASLARLAKEILRVIAQTSSPTKLLINSRADIAITASAHGVHLTAEPAGLQPAQVRSLYAAANLPTPTVTVSCHTLEAVRRAHRNEADAILFAPVFEKMTADHGSMPGQGLESLRAACLAASPIPVYALGGVTFENAPACLAAGAVGIAGIRLFHNC